MPESSADKLLRSQAALRKGSQHGSDYLAGLAERNVAPSATAIDDLSNFVEPLPEQPSESEAVLDMLNEYGSPASVATAGGRFFGLVVGGSLPACVGSRVLGAAWDQLATTEATSPVAAQLERVASGWLIELFGLPSNSSVGFVTGTTMGNFVCLAAARHELLRRLQWNVEKQGLFNAPELRVIASEEVHITVKKVLSMLGFGTDLIETVPVDGNGAILAAQLPPLDERCIVLTQAGNVNSGAIDPIGEIAKRAKEAGAWVHVDGAFGLWAAVGNSTKSLMTGFELADSWVTDGHKWLNTPYDCGVAMCRHPQAVHSAMSTVAPYFKAGEHTEAKDMAPELSRSARGIDMWAALKSLGRSGVANMVDECCQHAQLIASQLDKMGFTILNDVVLNQVVVTHPSKEQQLDELVKKVLASGEAWFGLTQWKGRTAFRVSVSSWVTTEEDVIRTIAAIDAAAKELKF